MKTINISEDDLAFLKECQKELKTQDNRMTRNPIYVIYDENRVYGFDGDYSCNYLIRWDDTFYTVKEFVEYLYENEYKEEMKILYDNCFGTEVEEVTKEIVDTVITFLDNTFSSDVEDIVKAAVDDCYLVWYVDEFKQKTNGACFSFFEKDAKDHLEANKHHYTSKAYTYADSIWRTPRMEKLLELLTKIDLGD